MTTTTTEIDSGIFRISTGVDIPGLPGGFSFNQFLILDDQPLLFHTGPRKLFSETESALRRVLPLDKLRWIAFSHFEADECGALNAFLAASAIAEPLCGQTAAMVSVNDVSDRPARALADGESITIGRHRVRWMDTPHLPHAWECGYLFEETSSTLFCGDLFTQPGSRCAAVTEEDILSASEAMRAGMDYYAHSKNSRDLFQKLANTDPRLLACMHGSCFKGNGRALLMRLADRICPTE